VRGYGTFLLNYCVQNLTTSFTFLLAKNSMPRAICNDHEIKSFVFIIWLAVAFESCALQLAWFDSGCFSTSFPPPLLQLFKR
jgi:hypothetical protein